jgi:hypothetical protein
MPNYNIRVSKHSYEALKALSAEYGGSMQSVVDQAVENLRRKKILEDANSAFLALKRNKQDWNEELEEREIWEKTLADGLDNK